VDAKLENWILYCDGASRGNPGPAAYGFVLYCGEEVVLKGGKRLGITTNNVAEYEALFNGLRESLKRGVTVLTIRSDSEVVVKQIKREYKVKAAHLHALYEKVMAELGKFKSFRIEHVRREENKLADQLANEALDTEAF